ncbi:MAG: helix-turn-helix transcriptional regulator [Pseudanabaena sp.]|jgi:DNA-binding XRE family transcriptional regulator
MEKPSSEFAMLRRYRDISQSELARILGVSKTTIYKWESGLAHPRLTPRQTKDLCKALRITLDELPDDFASQPLQDQD